MGWQEIEYRFAPFLCAFIYRQLTNLTLVFLINGKYGNYVHVHHPLYPPEPTTTLYFILFLSTNVHSIIIAHSE